MSSGTDHPNILVILADQMRFPGPAGGGMPEDLAQILRVEDVDDANRFARFFPGMLALRRHAVVLRQHCIGSSACTPSRGVLFTGQYGSRTGLTQTSGMAKSGTEHEFPWLAADGIPTLGDWFRAAGYSTHWFGKWHLSEPPFGSLSPWGFEDGERSSPEPHGANPMNLGVYRDPGFADDVIAFLRERRRTRGSPWLAVASLVNPHDVSAFPIPWWPGVDVRGSFRTPTQLPAVGAHTWPLARGESVALNPDGFPEDCFDLPATLDEDLTATKPTCHGEAAYKIALALRARWPGVLRASCPLPFQLASDDRGWVRAFGRYYAYLHHLVDREIARIVAALHEGGLDHRTIVAFTSDHGEHAGAHGGMIHKWHTAYDEIVRVPFVISSPLVNSDASVVRSIDVPTSHADLVPTLLSLAGFGTPGERATLGDRISGHKVMPLVGADLRDVLLGRTVTVSEADGEERTGALFVTDDEITVPLSAGSQRRWQRSFVREIDWARARGVSIAPEVRIAGPSHVQCVRTARWKYARYWDPHGDAQAEWELYRLDLDPAERHNLVGWEHGEPVSRPERIPRQWELSPAVLETEQRRLHGALERCTARCL